MSIWLLEAKAWPEDTRSESATSSRFWLIPGTYTVGRKEGQCDIDVPEDKSISRIHAEIKVPSTEELQEPPSIAVTDKSRYGTLVSKENNLQHDGQVGTVQQAEHRWLLRFGFQSPFRVKKLDFSVVLHPSCSQETRTLATEFGFKIRDEVDEDLSEHHEFLCLVMPSSDSAHIDGFVLKALMSSVPVVSSEWLVKWKERKVWKNEYPKYEYYPVNFGSSNNTSVPRDDTLEKARDAVHRQPLQNLKFLWNPEEKESADRIILSLQSATILAGGKAVYWPNSRAQASKLNAENVILVVPSQEDRQQVALYLQEFKWITHDLLIQAILNGHPLQYINNPEDEDDEKTVGTAAGAGYPVGTVPDSEDEADNMELEVQAVAKQETDVDEDLTKVVDEEKVNKAGKAKSKQSADTPSRATRSKRKLDTAEELVNEEKLEESKGKRSLRNTPKSPTAPLSTAASPASTKRPRTRGANTKTGAAVSKEDSISILVDYPPSVHPSPSKTGRGRRGTVKITTPTAEAPVAAVLETEAPAPSPAADSKNKTTPKKKPTKTTASIFPSPGKNNSRKARHEAVIPSPPPQGQGWRSTVGARKKNAQQNKQATTIDVSGGDPAVHPADAAVDDQSSPPAENNNTTSAAVPAAAAAAVAAPADGPIEASIVILDTSLIVALPNTTRLDNGYGTGGFKAFRRNGSTIHGGTYRLPKIPFDPEPYREGTYRNEEFLREEAEKEAATKVADALFDANLKPKRDKKAVEEEKKKLIAMLPEAARRRLG